MPSLSFPAPTSWAYDRAELIADRVIHVAGVALGAAGVVALAIIAIRAGHAAEIGGAFIYAGGLIAMLVGSAAYNIWPVSPVKWLLRRFDHSAIYLLIAGTYTPFLLHVRSEPGALAVLAAIWLIATAGIAVKFLLPGRFDRVSIAAYLALGWCGALVYGPVVSALMPLTLWLIAIGGALYSAGVVFHVWERLRFHNAIWHGFVLCAAGFHYAAVLSCLM